MCCVLWYIFFAAIVTLCPVQPIPSSNTIRFRTIEVTRPFRSVGTVQHRHLLGDENHTNSVTPLAEFGVARMFGNKFDDRFPGAHAEPHLNRAVKSNVEACVRFCVETAGCRSWYLDEHFVCSLYYVTVRGYPLKGAVSGDYDPPSLTVLNGSVTSVGGHACVCGNRETMKRATSPTTRESVLAHLSGHFHYSRSPPDSILASRNLRSVSTHESKRIRHLTHGKMEHFGAPHLKIFTNETRHRTDQVCISSYVWNTHYIVLKWIIVSSPTATCS